MAEPKQALGIDVSHYKNQIDWARVKESGIKFAIIKATEGDSFVDSRFDYNWTRARRVGMIRGAYHFFRPLIDPSSQARHFLRIVGDILHKTDLPPVLDVEVYPDFIKTEYKKISASERQQRIRVWLQTIQTATGRTPMIYTDYYTWRDYIGNSEAFSGYPLWIAAYKVDQPKIPANIWGGKDWTLWQYTNNGVVPGIRDEAACVDMNHYRGSLDELKSWLGITEERAIPPSLANGDMMAAIIDAAEAMGDSSDQWVARTGLRYLVDPIGNSLRPYDGPAVEDLPLKKKEKAALITAIETFSVNLAALGITHQDMINAIYYAASLESLGGWSLVVKAGIGYIGDDREAVYKGPAIEDLPGLTDSQKDAIAAYLGVELTGDELEEQAEAVEEVEEEGGAEDSAAANATATYSDDLTNQDMINGFHLMALELDGSGQLLLAAAGLEDLSEARTAAYSGPQIEDLPGLTWDLKIHLAGLLNVALVMPDGEIQVDALEGAEDPAEAETVEVEVDAQTEDDQVEAQEIAQEPEVEEVPETIETQAETEDEPYTGIDDETFAELVEQLPVVDLTDNGDTDEEQEVDEVEEQRSWLPLITNQEVIEAFFQVAETIGREGWSLLQQAGLLDLDLDRAARFTGLSVDKIEDVGEDVVAMVAEALGVENQKSLTRKSVAAEPYPGMVNLDMVNMFYKAAARLGENGQQWLNDSGMSYLNKSRIVRFKPYQGPEIAEFEKLTHEQRSVLLTVLKETVGEYSPTAA